MASEYSNEGMLEMYLYENGQLLEKLEELVLEYKDEKCFSENAINEIFRIMHTIKGSSGVMMYENIMTVSHKLEDIFYVLRDEGADRAPHSTLIDYMFEVMDYISAEFDKIRNGDEPDGEAQTIIDSLEKFYSKIKNGEVNNNEEDKNVAMQFYVAPASNVIESRYYTIKVGFHQDTAMSNIRAYSIVYALKEIAEDILYYPEDIVTNEESADVILAEGFKIHLQTREEKDKISSLVDNSAEISYVEIEECSQSDFAKGFYDFETPAASQTQTEINLEDGGIIIAPAESVTEKKATSEPQPGDYVIKEKIPGKPVQLAKQHKKTTQSLMSISIEKMDALMNLMGELVIAESVVLQSPDLKVPGLELSNFQKAAGQLNKITSEMQEIVMSMRMMPLTNTFQKMNRTVYDISKKLGKVINFEMIGETTEVDKNIIEHISDPLMHMVRNAVDHGIELPEEREKAGKTEPAKIILEAKNEGGKVWVSVKDNGKGLSREGILKKAIENKLIDAKDAAGYSDKDVYQFITYPGFSTKEKVTEYSGRGVGMDVVVKNIQEVGGRLEIDSVEGQGSVMTMKIPLTLAIIDGILMIVGKSVFVIETGAVKEFIKVTEDMLVVEPDGKEYVMLRGNAYPLLRIADKYKIADSATNVEDGVILVVEYEGKPFCVLIDSLIGTQEIVVKPMPSYIKKIPGISGCTQLGDGNIALILDIGGLTHE